MRRLNESLYELKITVNLYTDQLIDTAFKGNGGGK